MLLCRFIIISALFYSVNLSAKEKQIGYYDSLAVLKDLPTFELIEKKVEGSILLELFRKDIDELTYHHELMTKELDSLKPTLTEEEIAARNKNLAEFQVTLDQKQKNYKKLFETMRQEQFEFIRVSLRSAIDTIKKRFKLGKVMEINHMAGTLKSGAMDVTSQIREELFRLEKERCVER